MRSSGLKLFLLAALFLASVLLGVRVVAAEGQPSMEPSAGDLGDVKTRLTAIEERQKEILAKEDQILAELDRIRIWVHRK